MKTNLITLVCICLASLGAGAQDNFDSVVVKSQKLSNQVYMLEGSGGNIGVLTGSEGILIVDDQFAPLTEKIKAAIKTLDPGSVKFVINTHVHGDHAGGNENFAKGGATIIAHDNVRKQMETEKEQPTPKGGWPVITFSAKSTVHLNGEVVDVYHFLNGHTNGDVLIHFKNANVFHAGDLFVRYGYPYIDYAHGGSINGFITNLEKMIELMDVNSKVIPGHGALAARADVQLFHDQMKDIRDKVQAALKKGTKKQDLTALGITTKYDVAWGKGYLKGNDFVTLVADDLLKK